MCLVHNNKPKSVGHPAETEVLRSYLCRVRSSTVVGVLFPEGDGESDRFVCYMLLGKYVTKDVDFTDTKSFVE